MKKEPIFTEKAPKPVGPYSQAIKFGNLIYCSGQIAIDPATNEFIKNRTYENETFQVMKNLISVLEEAGSSLQKVLRTTIYLKDINQFSKVNEIYSDFLKGTIQPSRACIEVSRLPKDALVEIDCISYVDD